MMLGSRVRSQDGTQVAHRGRHRDRARLESQIAGGSPRVQWTEPVLPTTPNPGASGAASLAALPPPPVLSDAPGSIRPAPVGSREPATTPERTASPEPDAAPAPSLAKLRDLIAGSQSNLSQIRNYQVAMRRQERVGDVLQPAEDLILSIRREPRAVRLEWAGSKNPGREVIYSATETGGQLQIHTPGSLLPDMTLAPDSPLVLRSSRHPITEAGLDSILQRLEQSLQPHLAGTPTRARLAYEGLETPPEIGRPCHKIVEHRENGEVWVVYLDSDSLLPAMLHATAAGGELLEHYAFRDLKIDLPELAHADAFRPEARWGSSKGFLSRVARGGPPEPANSSPR